MTFTVGGKRQRLPLISCSFLLILKSHQNRNMSPTIHRKNKYFHSTVQTAEERTAKVSFLPIATLLDSCLKE